MTLAWLGGRLSRKRPGPAEPPALLDDEVTEPSPPEMPPPIPIPVFEPWPKVAAGVHPDPVAQLRELLKRVRRMPG